MKGITNYKPTGYEKRAFQSTDKLARKIKGDIKRFSKGKR